MVLFYTYSPDYLRNSFKRQQANVTETVDLSDVTVKDCMRFAGEKGWTVRFIKEKDSNDPLLVYYNGTPKQVSGNGYLVMLSKGDKFVKAFMESKVDAFLVCILEILREQFYDVSQ